jgi:glycine cleavage system H lipoate-binding protein
MYYHRGHSWAYPNPHGVVAVGIDDLAQRVIGTPSSVQLPAIGRNVRQGTPGWTFVVGAQSVDILCPLDGVVIEHHRAVLNSPVLINRDPYDRGWLMKIEATQLNANLNNLLHGKTAHRWLETTEKILRQRIPHNLHAVLEDGGMPMTGVGRYLPDKVWHQLVKELFLTE